MIQTRPAQRSSRIVAVSGPADMSSLNVRTLTVPASRTRTVRSGGPVGSSPDAETGGGCSIQATASLAFASVWPCRIVTPPVRCQTSYEPSVHREACVASMPSSSRGFAAGTSMCPASAIAAANPLTGSSARPPAGAVGAGGSAAATTRPMPSSRQHNTSTNGRLRMQPPRDRVGFGAATISGRGGPGPRWRSPQRSV
jgi:hypothetical protein